VPPDRAARDRLVLENLGWARGTVMQAIRRLRIRIDPDEAIAAANLALVEVAARYVPGGDASFVTFAHRRIVGAVLDRAHELSEAYRQHAAPGMSYPPAPIPLDLLAKELRADYRGTDDAEARHDVGRLLAVLDAREREVLRLTFVEVLPLADVGERLGVTESRVWQIREEALGKMRRAADRW
jgi:RNA polymerase sigma factor (sigma-70 family)